MKCCTMLVLTGSGLQLDVDFRVATLVELVQRLLNSVYALFDPGPGGSHEDDDAKGPTREVLLVLQVLIRRDQSLVPSRFGLIEKLTVVEAGPAPFGGGVDLVGMEVARRGTGVPWGNRTLIPSLLQQRGWQRRGSGLLPRAPC